MSSISVSINLWVPFLTDLILIAVFLIWLYHYGDVKFAGRNLMSPGGTTKRPDKRAVAGYNRFKTILFIIFPILFTAVIILNLVSIFTDDMETKRLVHIAGFVVSLFAVIVGLVVANRCEYKQTMVGAQSAQISLHLFYLLAMIFASVSMVLHAQILFA